MTKEKRLQSVLVLKTVFLVENVLEPILVRHFM